MDEALRKEVERSFAYLLGQVLGLAALLEKHSEGLQAIGCHLCDLALFQTVGKRIAECLILQENQPKG